MKSAMKLARRSTAVIGMHGIDSAAAELARRGFTVSPTSRSALGADLLVTDQRCRRAWSVQVKTTERQHPASYCLAGRHAKDIASDSHIYIFVSYKEDKPNFLVVPSRTVAKYVRLLGGWLVLDRKHAKYDKDDPEGWRVFGDPSGIPAKSQAGAEAARRRQGETGGGEASGHGVIGRSRPSSVAHTGTFCTLSAATWALFVSANLSPLRPGLQKRAASRQAIPL